MEPVVEPGALERLPIATSERVEDCLLEEAGVGRAYASEPATSFEGGDARTVGVVRQLPEGHLISEDSRECVLPKLIGTLGHANNLRADRRILEPCEVVLEGERFDFLGEVLLDELDAAYQLSSALRIVKTLFSGNKGHSCAGKEAGKPRMESHHRPRNQNTSALGDEEALLGEPAVGDVVDKVLAAASPRDWYACCAIAGGSRVVIVGEPSD